MARILVVGDDQVRTMLCRTLESAGYEVADAPNAEEGIRPHRKRPADLVIADMIMPQKDGLATKVELRYDFAVMAGDEIVTPRKGATV